MADFKLYLDSRAYMCVCQLPLKEKKKKNVFLIGVFSPTRERDSQGHQATEF